jgi:hypothetical protein
LPRSIVAALKSREAILGDPDDGLSVPTEVAEWLR